jgi:hypothetical protein
MALRAEWATGTPACCGAKDRRRERIGRPVRQDPDPHLRSGRYWFRTSDLCRLRGPALDATDQRQVDEVMAEGPTTTRADEALEALVARMRPRHVTAILVTDPDGRLIGLLRLEDAERALAHPSTG